MFLLLLKKEIKVFFTNKGNLVFMVLLPILLISLFSFALGDYIQADYGTFEDGKVLYYSKDAPKAKIEGFKQITEQITAAAGIVFEQTEDYEKAKEAVEASGAYGVITITAEGYEYFRSTFNEPEGGKLVRTLFVQMADKDTNETTAVKQTTIEAKQLDSKIYYTFSALTFSIIFMGLLVAHSVYNEKELDTIKRIKVSRVGISGMLLSKIITGLLCGTGQFVSAFLFSSFILDVNWGSHLLWIAFILLLLILFSAVFGAVIGMLSKNKSMCQSIVLMFSMLCGYLGGSITPVYLLESMPVLNTIVKLSPLYWTNQALISLYNGILDKKTLYSTCILIGLSAVVFILFMLLSAAGKKNSAYKKEALQS